MLRTVELSLRSIQTSETDAISPVLLEIERIKDGASTLIEELNGAVKKSLRDSDGEACASEIKVAKRKWLRQSKNILKFRSDLNAMVISLSAALTALNAIQLASLRKYITLAYLILQQWQLTHDRSDTQRITFAIQDVSLVAEQDSAQSDMTIEEDESLETRLTRTMTVITEQLSSPSAPIENNARSLLAPINAASVVRVMTSIGREACTRFCRCQCHIQVKATSPRWATKMLGSFHFQSNGTVLLNRRRCNHPMTCKRSGAVTAQFAYYAPSWALARAFALGIVKDDIRGIAAYFGTGVSLRVPAGSRIFRLVEQGDVDAVRNALVRGQGSLFDVDELGETILHVSFCIP